MTELDETTWLYGVVNVTEEVVCGRCSAANAFLVRARERVWELKMSFFPVVEANRAPLNHLAGFKGLLRGGEKRAERGRK